MFDETKKKLSDITNNKIDCVVNRLDESVKGITEKFECEIQSIKTEIEDMSETAKIVVGISIGLGVVDTMLLLVIAKRLRRN